MKARARSALYFYRGSEDLKNFNGANLGTSDIFSVLFHLFPRPSREQKKSREKTEFRYQLCKSFINKKPGNCSVSGANLGISVSKWIGQFPRKLFDAGVGEWRQISPISDIA